MRRRNRSPLWGNSKSELALLRALATAVRDWKRAAIEGNYYPLPYAMTILGNDGGVHQARVLDMFEVRAWEQLERQPNFAAICEADRLARLRRYDPAAYEMAMLRRRVDDLVAATREARGS